MQCVLGVQVAAVGGQSDSGANLVRFIMCPAPKEEQLYVSVQVSIGAAGMEVCRGGPGCSGGHRVTMGWQSALVTRSGVLVGQQLTRG